MADIVFRGDAVAVAQVTTITVGGTWATSDTVTLTINGKSFTVTLATSVAVADVVAAVVAAWNGATAPNDATRDQTGNNIPEMNEVTASGSASPITLTADTAGKPFTVSVSKSSTAGTVGSPTNATTNAGPNVIAANNLTGAALPSATDVLTFENSTVDALYDLDAITNTLSVLNIKSNYEAKIGLPRLNGTYHEYRTRPLTLNADEVVIGEGTGKGSTQIILDLQTNQVAVKAYKSASSSESGFHAIRLEATHVSNTLEASGTATVDVAAEEGQTSQFSSVQTADTAKVRLSQRTTVATIQASGGSEIDWDSASSLTDVTSATVYDRGKIISRGDNAVGTVNVYGSGIIELERVGTITNLNVGSRGRLDASKLTINVTVTNCTCEEGATILDPQGRITFTNAIDLGAGNAKNCTFDFGDGRDIKPS